jgi:large subunit ribosomal protein L19
MSKSPGGAGSKLSGAQWAGALTSWKKRKDNRKMDIESLVELKPNPDIPEIHPGDTVKVSLKIKEGERERTQAFQGIVIGSRKGKAGANFTVRRVTHGIGVERTFFLYSPLLEKVEVLRQGKVRRAKLNYLRGLSSKQARITEKR